MKIILTITLSFVYLCGYGQADTLTFRTDQVWMHQEPKQMPNDTISVILFYIDTASEYHLLRDDNTIDTFVFKENIGVAHWTFGYEVRKITVEQAGQHRSNDGFGIYYLQKDQTYYDHLLYLDDKKKPLPASIIVWQTINRK